MPVSIGSDYPALGGSDDDHVTSCAVACSVRFCAVPRRALPVHHLSHHGSCATLCCCPPLSRHVCSALRLTEWLLDPAGSGQRGSGQQAPGVSRSRPLCSKRLAPPLTHPFQAPIAAPTPLPPYEPRLPPLAMLPSLRPSGRLAPLVDSVGVQTVMRPTTQVAAAHRERGSVSAASFSPCQMHCRSSRQSHNCA